MSNDKSPPRSPSERRASFTPGTALSEIFGRSPTNQNGNPTYPGQIATAAANAQAHQRRRTSIASLGMAGSPTQTSPFGNLSNCHNSFGSSTSPSTSIEENAIEEGDAAPPTPSSPFARRMSFGARALRDVRTGTGNANGRSSNQMAPSVKGRGEGFDWSESIKNRAERSSSITNRPALASNPPAAASPGHHKAASVPAVPQPVKELPKAPKQPDYIQERILKGEFYLD